MTAAPTFGLLAKIFSGPCLGCGATVNVYADPEENVDVFEPVLCAECLGKLVSKLQAEEGASL